MTPLDPHDPTDRAVMRRYLVEFSAAQPIQSALTACLDALDHPPEPQIPILNGDVDTTYLDPAGGEAHVALGASDRPHPFAITDRDDLILIAEQCRDLFEAMEEPDNTCELCAGTGVGQHGPPDVARCRDCGGRGYRHDLPERSYDQREVV